MSENGPNNYICHNKPDLILILFFKRKTTKNLW